MKHTSGWTCASIVPWECSLLHIPEGWWTLGSLLGRWAQGKAWWGCGDMEAVGTRCHLIQCHGSWYHTRVLRPVNWNRILYLIHVNKTGLH